MKNLIFLKIIPLIALIISTVFISYAEVQNKAEQKTDEKQDFKRIKEIGGEVLIDGSLRVVEPIIGKVFDLVEVSTPVTPASNHARIFLRADGTKQSLVIIFDDATTVKITGN